LSLEFPEKRVKARNVAFAWRWSALEITSNLA